MLILAFEVIVQLIVNGIFIALYFSIFSQLCCTRKFKKRTKTRIAKGVIELSGNKNSHLYLKPSKIRNLVLIVKSVKLILLPKKVIYWPIWNQSDTRSFHPSKGNGLKNINCPKQVSFYAVILFRKKPN